MGRSYSASLVRACVAAALPLVVLPLCVHADVTNVAWYRLGENDPGAASGVVVTNTTTDCVGVNHLKQFNGPRYTNAVFSGAPGGFVSSLAVLFNGTNQYLTNSIVSTATNNFGLEVWVKPNTTNSGYIAQNGFLYVGGWAIAQFSGRYQALMEATPLNLTVGDGSAIASLGIWTHLALVRNNGTNRFYVNGVTNGPPTTDAPFQPFRQFTIGANFTTNFAGGYQSNSYYNGTIDEVRVFTFAPGQFSVSDLLYNASVVTLPATNIPPPNTTLNGSVNPRGFPTTAWFEWGTTTNYGSVTPAQFLGSGTGATNFNNVLTGLLAGVTYHFRAAASNSLGVAVGTNQSLALHASALGSSMFVGTNINISRANGNNGWGTIVINPINPSNLFAGETMGLLTKYSTNGGATWLSSNLSALPASNGDWAGAWDDFGNLFLVYREVAGHIVVCLSTNGGGTFSLVYQGSISGAIQPSIATGPGNVPGQGSVWVTFSDSVQGVWSQQATVTGLGAVGIFSAEQTVPSGNGRAFGDIAVGPTGQVMVAYQSINNGVGPDAIGVNVDPDGLGAAGFGGPLIPTITQVGAFAPIPAQPHWTIDAEAGLAWDRSDGPHRGRVYLVYTDRPSTSSADTDIYVRYSDNNGATWSSPVRVNDDVQGNGKSQFLPRIALDQTTGNIAVCFYDCGNSVPNNAAELWASASVDGGLTFLPNVKVSAGVSSALVVPGSLDFGSYTSLAFHAGNFYPCWADNSNSTGDNPNGALSYLDFYTAKVTLNVPPVLFNPRVESNEFRVSVRTIFGRNYFLEGTESLVPPSWVARPAVLGDGNVKTLVDTNVTVPQKFYRARVQ